MRTAVLFFIFQLFAWFLGCESSWAKPNIKGTSPNKTLSFIENKGQWDDAVLFQCRLANMDAWITKTGVNYTFYQIKPDTLKPQKTNRNPKLDYLAHMNDSVLIHRVIMDYAGANANPRGEGKFKQTAYYNYFIGNDTTKHASFVGLYSEVIVHDVYPHIDIRYYFERGQLRYDYVVNPGGDPKQIRFNYRGQNGEEVKNNQLLLNTRFGEVAVRDLYCYQDKQAIPGEFVKQGNYWQFALGEYDTQKTLIIDPLIFSTFLGGSLSEVGNDIDIDNQGNSYIVGTTTSINYQVTIGAYNTTLSGDEDIFVSKLNPTGTNLIFSTFVGGNSTDRGTALKVDTAGCIYFTGFNYIENYPVTPGAYQLNNSSVYISNYFSILTEVVVTKLNATGSNLLYSTYLGGAGADYGFDIDIDQLGCAYVCGYTSSVLGGYPFFDITPGAYMTYSISEQIGFATKINPTGTGLVYSTFLGGYISRTNAIKVNSLGEAFVFGESYQSNFPVTNGAYSFNAGDTRFIYLQRLNPAGTGLIYSVKIDGDFYDLAHDLVIDNNNNAVIVGATDSYNFPSTGGAYQPLFTNNSCYIMRFNSVGALYFSILFCENIVAVDIDSEKNIYLLGDIDAYCFTTTPGAYQTTKDMSNELFFAKLDSNATSLIYATYLGASGSDFARSIRIDSQGNAFITGYTNSSNFDITPNVIDDTYNGVSEVFVAKLEPCVTMTVSAASSSPVLCINDTFPMIYHTCTGAYSLGAPVNFPPGLNATLSNDSIIISGTPLLGGIYNYQIPLLGSCGNIVATGTISISPYAQLSSAPGTNNQYVCVNTQINNITYTLGGGANGVIINGLPSGITGTLSNGIVTISGTPNVSGYFTYQIKLTGGCDTTSIYGTILVGLNTITLTSLSGTDSQQICINTYITPITYMTNGATGAVFNGLPVGVSGIFNNGIISIFGAPVISGNFTYTILLTGGCINDSIQGNIMVNPDNTIVFSSGSIGAVQVCVNTPITNQIYTSTGATGAIYNNLPPGVTGSFNNGTIVLSGTPTVAGNFGSSILLTGGCGIASINRYFIVYPNKTINLSSGVGSDSQQVCANIPLSNITYTSFAASGAVFSGLPPGISGTYTNGNIVIAGIPTSAGVYNYTVTLSGGCGNASATGIIEVIPSNPLSLISGFGSDSQQICFNAPITNIIYASSGATGAVFSGLPPGVIGTYTNGTIEISGTPTSVGIFTYTVLLTGGCGIISGNIGVWPNISSSLSSIAGSDSQVVCVNTPITNITYSTTGTTGATFSGLPQGVIGSFNNGNLLISGTPTNVGLSTYTILLSGPCGNTTVAGSIYVKPINTITLSSMLGSDSQTVCVNTPISNLTYNTTGATGAVFSGIPSGVVRTFTNGNVIISGTPTFIGLYTYTIILTGGCGLVSTTGQIQVNPNNTINLSSAVGTNTQQVCVNFPITNITYTTTDATGAIFSGLPSGVTGIFNNGNVLISGRPTSVGTFPYTVLLTGGCGNVIASGQIQVKPNNTISLSSAVGSDTQQVCVNNPITNITYTSTGATSAMFNGLPPGVVGSFNNGNIDISGTTNTVGYFNYSVDLSGGCGTIGSSGVLDVKRCSVIVDHDFGVYPNPNQNWFTIFSKQGYDIELSAMSGQKIRVYHMKSAQQTISENLAKGVYFLREVQSGKVMKLVVE
jgi:hypothetical protein